LLPYLDRAFSALIEDLAQRGLLDETLVVLMSEMGRKTRIGDPRPGGSNGRDHWVHCQTVLFAGGGIKPGFVLGASDNTASYPVDRPVGPEDLAATIYHALGIDDLTAQTRDGRQINLSEDGEPMRELFA
jgi:arylsulfatase A-like enzyme